MTAANTNAYIAYLIRLWREGPGVWRGMLQKPQTGERHYFANVDDLLTFLRQQAQPTDGGVPPKETTGATATTKDEN